MSTALAIACCVLFSACFALLLLLDEMDRALSGMRADLYVAEILAEERLEGWTAALAERDEALAYAGDVGPDGTEPEVMQSLAAAHRSSPSPVPAP